MANVIASKMTEEEFIDLMSSMSNINLEEKGLSGKNLNNIIKKKDEPSKDKPSAESIEIHNQLIIELNTQRQTKFFKDHYKLIVNLGKKIEELQDGNDALSEKLAKFYNQSGAEQQLTIREIFALPEEPTLAEFQKSKLNVAIAENIPTIKTLIESANQSAEINLQQAANDLLEDNIFNTINKINQQKLAKTQSVIPPKKIKDKLPSKNEQKNIPDSNLVQRDTGNLEQQEPLQDYLKKIILNRGAQIRRNATTSSRSSSRSSSDGDSMRQTTINVPENKEDALLKIKYSILND